MCGQCRRGVERSLYWNICDSIVIILYFNICLYKFKKSEWVVSRMESRLRVTNLAHIVMRKVGVSNSFIYFNFKWYCVMLYGLIYGWIRLYWVELDIIMLGLVVLSYIELCWVMLCCGMLCCDLFCCIVLCCVMLFYIAMCCVVLCCIVL